MVVIIGECFQLERIEPVSNIMALAIHSSNEIEDGITQPVKNEQHLHLLPEMDLLMADKLGLIMGLARYPDEYEK